MSGRFKFPTDPQAAEDRVHLKKQQARYAGLNDASLVASAEHTIANCTPLRWGAGAPVYDATLFHVILPELMKRVKERGRG